VSQISGNFKIPTSPALCQQVELVNAGIEKSETKIHPLTGMMHFAFAGNIPDRVQGGQGSHVGAFQGQAAHSQPDRHRRRRRYSQAVGQPRQDRSVLMFSNLITSKDHLALIVVPSLIILSNGSPHFTADYDKLVE